MNQLDTKCTLEQFNLLEIMLVGRTVMAVMKELYPQGSAPPQTKGTIVTGSLEGDVHDLGKNIFKMVLTGKGYRAVDCGKDCPVETLIDRWLLQRFNGRPVHILVVDDEPLVGELFKESLNENIYQVTTTLSSPETLELVSNKHFDIIFLDLLIPELDEAELFHRIRQMDKELPFAIITGYPDSDLINRAMEHGPFIVMKKPFTGDDIIGTVRSFVR